MRRRRSTCYFLTLIATGVSAAGLSFSSYGEPSSKVKVEHNTPVSRIRASNALSQFSMEGKHFTGNEVQGAYERVLSENWFIGGTIGQAYTLDGSFNTLFTSLEINVWYSLWGPFAPIRRSWQDDGHAVATYSATRMPALRVGLGTQQYFFNKSTGAVPFSGLGLKILYEFGLDGDFDLGLSVEHARLTNVDRLATASKGMLSVLWPLD